MAYRVEYSPAAEDHLRALTARQRAIVLDTVDNRAMKTLELAQATAPLADYARDVDKEPLVVTVRGRPVAALMPIENADRETVTLSTNPQFLALIERSRRHHETEGGISSEEMRGRLRAERVARPGKRRKAAHAKSR